MGEEPHFHMQRIVHIGAALLLAAIALVLPECSGTDRCADSPYVLEKKKHIVALLRTHSPTGYRIVDGYYRLPEKFTTGGYTITARKVDLTPYIMGDSKLDLLLAVESVVHEICHGYSYNAAFDMIVQSRLPFNPEWYSYVQFLPGRADRLIKVTRCVPARMMTDYIPKKLRGPAFTYMEKPWSDIYVLHNEMLAYYHGASAGLDIEPAMKEKDIRTLGAWRMYLHNTGSSYCQAAELKYLIVTCMMAQEQIDRQSDAAVMANREFLASFLELADTLPGLRRRLDSERDYFLGALRKAGYGVRKNGNDLVVSKGGDSLTFRDPGADADKFERALGWEECRLALRKMRTAAELPRR